MVSVYVKNQPQIRIKWAIYKGGQVKENLDAAKLKVWLVSRLNRIPLSVSCDSKGNITAELPTLEAGVYGLKAIWFKDYNNPLPKRGMSEVQLVLSVQSALTEDCISDDITIAVKSEVNTSYGYDGMDAYELAVFRGTTEASEEDWLNSRGVTATVQGEGDDKTSVMSQAAVTKSLEKIRSVLGSAYHLAGIVDELPKAANIGDIYCLRSDNHSYACIGIEQDDVFDVDYTIADGSEEIDEYNLDDIKSLRFGSAKFLQCSTEEYKYFTITHDDTGKIVIVNCDESGNVLSEFPAYYDQGRLKYSHSSLIESKIVYGDLIEEKHAGDAQYQDFGLLQTIDYTPSAEDTTFIPSSGSMLQGKDNVQEGLDDVGIKTPSMELNMATALNLNSDVVNYNFRELANSYQSLLAALQMLVEKVEYITPDGFADVKDLVNSIKFGSLMQVKRVTEGGIVSSTTAVCGKAVCGKAVCGTI